MDVEVQNHDVDDDGRPIRTGTVWTASAHIITAVIGSGVLSLAWATSQLGWLFGPFTIVLFSLVTYYTSSLLADCYRSSDPASEGRRNYTYMQAVKDNLGKKNVWLCGLCQYTNLFGSSIGYTITAAISAAAIKKSNCYQSRGHDADCSTPTSMYMVCFGAIQIVLSQLPNFHNLQWISIIASVMSFTYAFIAIGLSLAQVVSGNTGKTTLTGVQIGIDVGAAEKVWGSFQALGDIAFAYSFSMILIEIQDTLRSCPAENKVMKKATLISITITTVFYGLTGCLGYAAFGNKSPGNILTGFGFYEPYWLVDFANAAVVVHIVGGYQVYLQPLFAAVEDVTAKKWPNLKLKSEYKVTAISSCNFNINIFRLVWRTACVILITILAILMPFFNDVLALLGAIAFWPLTVYFPVQMYVVQKQIPSFSRKWVMLQSLSTVCFVVSLAAAVGSVEGVITGLKGYVPFRTRA